MPTGQRHPAERSALKRNQKTEPWKTHGSAKALPRHAPFKWHYTKKRVLGKLKQTMNNKVQINETIDRDAEGNILKKGMMINIRTNSVNEAAELYRELKAALNGKVSNTPAANNTPTCECGSKMILRNGSKGQFYGCCTYPKCSNTKKLPETPRS